MWKKIYARCYKLHVVVLWTETACSDKIVYYSDSLQIQSTYSLDTCYKINCI
jgi:hypothetical protein